jgi:hypothetical protein
VKTSGGLHLHHLVWGIVLLMLSGFLRFVTDPASPWAEFLAAAFGVGAGLTLDEFALWIHLRDVYWSEEGRSSFDAVVTAALIGALIVCGVAPFDLRNGAAAVETLTALVLGAALLSTVGTAKVRGGQRQARTGTGTLGADRRPLAALRRGGRGCPQRERRAGSAERGRDLRRRHGREHRREAHR